MRKERKNKKYLQAETPSINSTSSNKHSTFNTQHSTLPKGWVWVKLGEVCLEPQYGWTTRAVKNGSIHLLRTSDITSGTIDWNSVPFCADEPAEIDKYLLKDGDIVISRAGSVGCSCLIKNPKNAIFASYLIRFRPLINEKYLALFLKSPFYWQSISEKSLGITIPNINASKLKQIPLPLPPLPEQHRIVAKIEELFTKLDAGVEALKKAKEQIKRYRQAVLKYAFEGKLTEEWRKNNVELLMLNDELKQTQNSTLKTQHSTFNIQSYEPAAVLLEKIKEERKKKLGKKYKELPPIDTSELPELPEGWMWVRLGEVSEITPEDVYSDFDPMLPTTFIPMSSIDELTGTIKNPVILPLKDARKGHTHFKENDVLFARITPCMENGKVAIARNLKNGLGFGSTEFIVIRPNNCVLPEIIFYFIRQESYRHKAKMHFKSTVGQLRVPKEFIILSEFPLPPLAEQHQIVEEIERRFSVADEVEKVIDNSLKQAERLRQSILKRAFEGKLVPQDPNDEPAEKLLERIKKEKNEMN